MLWILATATFAKPLEDMATTAEQRFQNGDLRCWVDEYNIPYCGVFNFENKLHNYALFINCHFQKVDKVYEFFRKYGPEDFLNEKGISLISPFDIQ